MPYAKSVREQVKELPEFDPKKKYTPRQLELYATKLLFDQKDSRGKFLDDGPIWLSDDQFQTRWKREIINQEGVPDPALVSGIYNRTHPQGRKVNSKQAREGGASFYG